MFAMVTSGWSSHDAAWHAALHAQPVRNAALLEFANQLLAELPPTLLEKLGIPTREPRLVISAERMRHALGRRGEEHEDAAAFIANHIGEAARNLRFMVLQPGRAGWKVLGYVAALDRYMALAIKFVPAKAAGSGSDELWISTAIPHGAETLADLEDLLVPLSPSPDLNVHVGE